MTTLRGSAALALFIAAAAMMGCPDIQAPQLPEGPEAPEGSEQFKPKGGNCCLRRPNSPALVDKKCGLEEASCCIDLEEDLCEDRHGLWFFTPEGCAGAC